jgi:hypothetical protein
VDAPAFNGAYEDVRSAFFYYLQVCEFSPYDSSPPSRALPLDVKGCMSAGHAVKQLSQRTLVLNANSVCTTSSAEIFLREKRLRDSCRELTRNEKDG